MNRTQKLAMRGLVLAVAMVLSYIEALIPFFGGVPGMKLGLPNLMVVLLLYHDGWKEAGAVNLLRIVLTGFLFGSLYGILFSLAGAACSFAGMCALKKSGVFSMAGVSIAGGVLHNAGQLLCAMFVVKTNGVIWLAGPLLLAGAVTGGLIGVAAARLARYFDVRF